MPITVSLPSLRSLYIEARFNGQSLAYGTGFVAMAKAGPVLLTNRHLVTGRDNFTNRVLSSTCGIPNELMILHHRKDTIGYWVERVEPLLDLETPRWIEHPRYGATLDVVAVPLTQLDRVELYPWVLGPSPSDAHLTEPHKKLPLTSGELPIAVLPADEVSVVGYPFGNRISHLPKGIDIKVPPHLYGQHKELQEKHRQDRANFNEQLARFRNGEIPEADVVSQFSEHAEVFRRYASEFQNFANEFQDMPGTKGGFPTWATGFIASEPALNYEGLPLFLIDCRSRQGQSGSPVIACRNSRSISLENSKATLMLSGSAYRFLGIYSGRINSESDIGMVWKARALRELL